MTDKTIVFLVVFVREFVPGFGLFVKAFFGRSIGNHVLDRMRRLKRDREQNGKKRQKTEYGKNPLHATKVSFERGADFSLTLF